MEMSLWKLNNLGVREENPDYLNTKIRTNNIVAVCNLMVAILYALFSWFFFPPLTWLPALGVPLILAALFLNYMGVHILSRLLVVFTPVIICFTYHEGLISQGSTPLAGSILLQGAFSLLPFILFDLRERLPLVLSSSVCFTAIVFFTLADGWIEYDLDDSLMRSGPLHEISVAIAMLLFYSAVYILAYLNAGAEKKSKDLLEKGEQQNQALNLQREEMEANLTRLEEAQEEERKRAWASEGFTRFGTIMRRNDNSGGMFDQLVSGIVKYIKANQAALYLAEGEGKNVILRQHSCYAFNRKKFREYSASPGQGMVGQVYLEKEYVYITEIPQQYTFITSGLGEATPSALLLIPLISNDVVEGVLEIASFKPFEKHVIDFLTGLGEEIAAMISINRINELTQKLLEEAQEQAEEMRAQEEEMRQNMEELQATQEEMARKEMEYLEKIRQLESALEENC